MKMSRVIYLALLLWCGFARADAQREVFPVPALVAHLFQESGPVAFGAPDPYKQPRPETIPRPTPIVPIAEAASLPAGVFYDIMPEWVKRGFSPHQGTRALYHPGTQLIFASIAPEDEEQVRAFCQWPAALWLGEFDRNSGTVRQTQFRVTAYTVPVTAAGDWKLRPKSPRTCWLCLRLRAAWRAGRCSSSAGDSAPKGKP